MISLPETGPELGRCLCGNVTRKDSFRDKCSRLEFTLSGLCQACQDLIFLFPPPEAGATRHRIRFGALAAHRRSDRHVLEVAVLPFRFIPQHHVLAWEARHVLRIGSVLPFALPSELYPMASILAGHRVRVTEVYSDARLAGWFSDLDLLLALDADSLNEIVGACPALGGGLQVALAEAVPWASLVGRPLSSLLQFVRSADLAAVQPGFPPSPLRVCARLGAALGMDDGRPLTHLLDFVRKARPEPPKPEGLKP